MNAEFTHWLGWLASELRSILLPILVLKICPQHLSSYVGSRDLSSDRQVCTTGALLTEPSLPPSGLQCSHPHWSAGSLGGISNGLGRTGPIVPALLCPCSEPVCDEAAPLLSAGPHGPLPTTLLLHLQIVTTERYCCRATGSPGAASWKKKVLTRFHPSLEALKLS